PRSPHPAWRRRAPVTPSIISTRVWSTISPSTASASPGASGRSSGSKPSSPSIARTPPPSLARWSRRRRRTRRARDAGNTRDRRRLEGRKGARESGAELLQDSLVTFGLLDRKSGREVGHGEPLGRSLEASDEHAAHFRTQIDGGVGHPDHRHLTRDSVDGGGD